MRRPDHHATSRQQPTGPRTHTIYELCDVHSDAVEPLGQATELLDLIGLCATPFSEAVLITATTLPSPGGPASGTPQGPRLLAHLVDRDQRAISITADSTDNITVHCLGANLLDDICRRALGLPCPADHTNPAVPALVGWATELVDLAFDPALSAWSQRWAGCVELFPFPASAGASPADLVEIAAVEGAATSWDRLWRISLEAGRGPCGLNAAELAWLDPPSFARLWLASLPNNVTLAAAVAAVLPAAVAEAVTTVLDSVTPG
jgi:hypothetical protein